jgi:hypothetical protein
VQTIGQAAAANNSRQTTSLARSLRRDIEYLLSTDTDRPFCQLTRVAVAPTNRMGKQLRHGEEFPDSSEKHRGRSPESCYDGSRERGMAWFSLPKTLNLQRFTQPLIQQFAEWFAEARCRWMLSWRVCRCGHQAVGNDGDGNSGAAVRGELNGWRFPPGAWSKPVWSMVARWRPCVSRKGSLASAIAFENRTFERRDSRMCFPRHDCRGAGTKFDAARERRKSQDDPDSRFGCSRKKFTGMLRLDYLTMF